MNADIEFPAELLRETTREMEYHPVRSTRSTKPRIEGGMTIPEVTPTDIQAKAISAIRKWFRFDADDQQIFRLFGYAGTGKTTLTKYAIAALGLSEEDVFFAAFTGKASYVMRKHGTPAQTICSMIYSVHTASDEQIAEAERKLEEMIEKARDAHGSERLVHDAAIAAMRTNISDLKRPQFGLNMEAEVRQAKLIVLDEVSMVDSQMAADLQSFGIPILVLGDPGQLPPIKGEGAFTAQEPDVMLTEIHRQALDSPIIRLATMARQGEPIGYGKYSDIVWKMKRSQVHARSMLRADQVICGRNATRLDLNARMRKEAGFANGMMPSGEAEKIICLRNINAHGLINGMFLQLSEIEHSDDLRFRAKIKDEEGKLYIPNSKDGRFEIYTGHFMDHYDFDKDRNDRDWKTKRNLVEATYGWAITCHKAQGSQWRNVIVYDDHLSRTADDRKRWLYTGLTRAEEGLVILD